MLRAIVRQLHEHDRPPSKDEFALTPAVIGHFGSCPLPGITALLKNPLFGLLYNAIGTTNEENERPRSRS
jgi:hypothetical protein